MDMTTDCSVMSGCLWGFLVNCNDGRQITG